MVKILIMTIQVNFVPRPSSTKIVVIKIFTINLPSQPFLGRHLGFHILFHHSLFEGRTLCLQLGCFALDNNNNNSKSYISGTLEAIALKFGMWSAEVGGSIHSKNRLVSSSQHRATEVQKLHFRSYCQYTHGCCAQASWAAGQYRMS